MKVENRVFPNREQMKGFFENTDDNEPIYMLNLLKFKEKAEYKDGRETNLTGREAYTIYAEFMDKHLKEIGGELVLHCLLYTSPSPRDAESSRMPSSA